MPALAALALAYALDVRGDSGLISHPLDDFGSATSIGAPGGRIHGLDFSPDGTVLHALDDASRQLGSIDPDTGVFTPDGPSAPRAGHSWTGLTADPLSGTLYASSSDGAQSTLYRLAPDGTPTEIGTQSVAPAIVDIAMSCAGELYAHDVTGNALFRLSTADGGATLVGPLGLDTDRAQGMDFDNETGTLYAWLYLGSDPSDLFPRYGTIDLATGAFTTLAVDESEDPRRELEGATRTSCAGLVFADGFESGDVDRWDESAPR